MAGLFADSTPQSPEDRRLLPLSLRQLIVDVKAGYPAFRLGEIAQICFVASGRRLNPHAIQRILATGPEPRQTWRRYPRYSNILDPAERRLAVIRLHSEGWTVTCIAGHLHTTRRTVYLTLRRWVEEGLLDWRMSHVRPSSRHDESICMR
jgi:putative transposase